MNSKISNDLGISPAVGVILLIGLSVATATLAGIVLLDIGDKNLNKSVNAGVEISETPDGVEVSWDTQGNAEEIKVQVNGETVSTLGNVNDNITLGVDKNETVSAIGVSEDGEQVIQEQTTSQDTNSTTGNEYTVKDQDIDGQTVTGQVSIKNTDIEGANVTVLDSEDSVVSSTTTDSNGSFDTIGSVGNKIQVTVNGSDTFNGNDLYASKKLKINSSDVTIEFDDTKVIDTGNGSSVVDNGSIGSVEELQAIPEGSSKEYTLLSDIDASKTSEWNSGNGFEPISNFSGTLNGNGHTISDLNITAPSEMEFTGLFGSITNATIKNVTIDNATIGPNSDARRFSGGISGQSENSNLTNVEVSNSTIGGRNDAGGLVGNMGGGTIKQSRSIDNKVNSGYDAGGVVGDLIDGSIEKSYAIKLKIGGENSEGVITADSSGSAIISNSYGRGSELSDVPIAGDVSFNDATVKNVYNTSGLVIADKVTNGYSTRYKGSTDGIKLGKYQMVEGAAEQNLSGFDFDTVWQKPNGDRYPTLQDNPEPTQQSELNINQTFYSCKDISYTTNGSGTLEVDSATKLQCIDSKPADTDFVLTSDIDASSISNFKPIKYKSTFNGSLNGNGHTISNLDSTSSSLENVGLFARLKNATVKNMTIDNATIGPDSDARRFSGGISGQSETSDLINLQVSNSTIGGRNDAGGLVGNMGGGTIQQSKILDNQVNSDFDDGGLVGEINDGSITQTYSINGATGGNHHFIGNADNTTISNSYVRYDNSSYKEFAHSVDLSNVYVINGDIDGESINNAYYNLDGTDSDKGTGLTESEMQGSSASSNMSNFDFTNVWTTQSNGYPILQDNSE